MAHLVITIRLHDGRYHGMGEWWPSPARFFQALVAAGAREGLPDDTGHALEWLEGLGPPMIGMPPMRVGQRIQAFGPNNDIDTVECDLSRVGDIRSSKIIEPKLFDPSLPFMYVWTFVDDGEDRRRAQTLCALAERLYQFGRGVDMAWAWAEVLDADELDAQLSGYPGLVYRPIGWRGSDARMSRAGISREPDRAPPRRAASDSRPKDRAKRPGSSFRNRPNLDSRRSRTRAPHHDACTNFAIRPARPRSPRGLSRRHRSSSSAARRSGRATAARAARTEIGHRARPGWTQGRRRGRGADLRASAGSCPCRPSDIPTRITGFAACWSRFPQIVRFVRTMCTGRSQVSNSSIGRPGRF